MQVKSQIELKSGEIICPYCIGKYIVGEEKTTIWGCEKCKGSGKLDWVEAIVGKKQNFTIWSKKIINSTESPKRNIGEIK